MEYYITKHDDSYIITKFLDSSFPVASYTVKSKKCDCPAGIKRGRCKHTTMVERWSPGFYIEQQGVILAVLPLSDELISDTERN